MTPEEVVRAELAAWDRLDVEGIMSYFTPDAIWENVPIGPATGHDEIRQAVEGWVGQTTSMDMQILNVAVAGHIVMTERVDNLVLNGESVHARVMGTFEIDGDKITAWRDYFDMGQPPG